MRLADVSAWMRARGEDASVEVRKEFNTALLAGEIATCEPVKAELLRWATSANFASIEDALDALPCLAMTSDDWQRVVTFRHALVDAAPALRRASSEIKTAALVVAAIAEGAGVGIVHDDPDFEDISFVVGVRVLRIGSVGMAAAPQAQAEVVT